MAARMQHEGEEGADQAGRHRRCEPARQARGCTQEDQRRVRGQARQAQPPARVQSARPPDAGAHGTGPGKGRPVPTSPLEPLLPVQGAPHRYRAWAAQEAGRTIARHMAASQRVSACKYGSCAQRRPPRRKSGIISIGSSGEMVEPRSTILLSQFAAHRRISPCFHECFLNRLLQSVASRGISYPPVAVDEVVDGSNGRNGG